MDPITAAVVVLFVLVVLLFAAGAGLYRRVRELELATYQGVGLNFAAGQGGEHAPSLAVAGTTTFLVKVNRRCPVCEDVLLTLGKIAPTLPDGMAFTVVSDDPDFSKDLPESVRVIRDPALWRSISVPYTPALLIIDEQGMVVYNTPVGSGEVVAETVGRAIARREEAQL